MESNLFSPHLVRGLTDKIYEKRKAAALIIEKLVRENEDNPARISEIIETLVNRFIDSSNSNAKNGGLIGLAATAIALGPGVAPYLDNIIPPILECFTSQDSRVRYYSCECMYNIAKVAKGEVLRFFNKIFDALCKLAADPADSVKSGADLLDRLIRDIVSELSTTYISVHQQPYNPVESQDETDALVVPTSLPRNTAFSLRRFIPLLSERIKARNSFTRQYLVSWISVLDSIPDLELVSFLPEFFGGLLNCLSDPSADVRRSTTVLLGEFLKEIKQTAAVTGDHSRDDDAGAGTTSSDIDDEHSKGTYVPGQGVIVQYDRLVEILVQHLSSKEEHIQEISLHWISEFIVIAPDVVIKFTPRIIFDVLPCLAHPTGVIRETARETNTKLQKLVLDASPVPKSSSSSAAVTTSHDSTTTTTIPQPEANESDKSSNKQNDQQEHHDEKLVESSVMKKNRGPSEEDPFDYQATVSNLRLQFLNENEDTRVAALEWLLMLHGKAPTKILVSDDGTFPALLKTLSDPSDKVVRRDLQLLAQISSHSKYEYFRDFMTNLLLLFSTDRGLLESRGSLIIRQLCVSLDSERIYTTIADILATDEDLEFASIMVQNLNIILITSWELADLRKRLRNLDQKDGQQLFNTLYRSWCHNAVATFSLCLLAQAYEHAANMLQIFAELEITVTMLIQVDKLVQLLESPVFTYLRLQLLEPEKYPYLFKCLYGILMLLPQSSAFSTLRNRLSSVSSLGFFHVMPNKGSQEPATTKTRTTKTKSADDGIKFQELLQHFKLVQSRHERQRKLANQNATSSNLKSRRSRYNSEPSSHYLRDDGNGSNATSHSNAIHPKNGATSNSSHLLQLKQSNHNLLMGSSSGSIGGNNGNSEHGRSSSSSNVNNSNGGTSNFMRTAAGQNARMVPRKTTTTTRR